MSTEDPTTRIQADSPLGAPPEGVPRIESSDQGWDFEEGGQPQGPASLPLAAPTPPTEGTKFRRSLFQQQYTQQSVEMPLAFLAVAEAFAAAHPLEGGPSQPPPNWQNCWGYGSAVQAAADLALASVHVLLTEHPEAFAWSTAAAQLLPRYLLDRQPQVDQEARRLLQESQRQWQTAIRDALSAKFQPGQQGHITWDDVMDALEEGADLDDA